MFQQELTAKSSSDEHLRGKREAEVHVLDGVDNLDIEAEMERFRRSIMEEIESNFDDDDYDEDDYGDDDDRRRRDLSEFEDGALVDEQMTEEDVFRARRGAYVSG